MNLTLVLAHWRSGLLGALAATLLVLLLAMTRTPQFAGVIEVAVLPKRVDAPGKGPFAREPLQAAELREQFTAFAAGDGLRQFLSRQDSLDLGGGAFAQGLLEQFRRRISLEPLNNGKVRIRVEDTRPRRAALLARNLAGAFTAHLERAERDRRRIALESWKEKVKAGEEKLNLLRQAILSFRRMRVEAVEKYGGEKREDWRQALLVEQTNSKIGVLEENVKAMSGLTAEEFLKAANRLKVLDKNLADLASEYLDRGSTARALDASGLSKDHVEVVASRQRLDDSRKRLDLAIARVLEKMKEDLKRESERRSALLAEREETWGLMGEIGKRLEETSQIYDTESAALAQTQAGLYAAQLESSLPVFVADEAASGAARLEMRGPSLVTDLVLAPLMGLLCGLMTVHLLAWRGGKRAPAEGIPGRSRPVRRKDRYPVPA